MTKKSSKSAEMRLDKWLWCARFYKTRSMATEAIRSGKVKIQNEPCKTGKVIAVGEIISIRKGAVTIVIEILSLTHGRLAAKEAVNLYDETADSIKSREK